MRVGIANGIAPQTAASARGALVEDCTQTAVSIPPGHRRWEP